MQVNGKSCNLYNKNSLRNHGENIKLSFSTQYAQSTPKDSECTEYVILFQILNSDENNKIRLFFTHVGRVEAVFKFDARIRLYNVLIYVFEE